MMTIQYNYNNNNDNRNNNNNNNKITVLQNDIYDHNLTKIL